ncbi:MAG: T9SS type A sorting domain-containing protein [Bacteroidetes bacterium]|nr:T9SS type A sorting domain-containing protein [Bacteroidota bacterium]MBL0096085.1 T9SS type A sorting domain-containing protein [Bacteroidota bacterium]
MKNSLFTLFLLVIFINTEAQTTALINWQQQYGVSPNNEFSGKVVVDSSNNVFEVGIYNMGSAFQRTIRILKYSSGGTLLASKSISMNASLVRSVVVDNSNNLYLVVDSIANNVTYVYKLSNNLNLVLWSKRYTNVIGVKAVVLNTSLFVLFVGNPGNNSFANVSKLSTSTGAQLSDYLSSNLFPKRIPADMAIKGTSILLCGSQYDTNGNRGFVTKLSSLNLSQTWDALSNINPANLHEVYKNLAVHAKSKYIFLAGEHKSVNTGNRRSMVSRVSDAGVILNTVVHTDFTTYHTYGLKVGMDSSLNVYVGIAKVPVNAAGNDVTFTIRKYSHSLLSLSSFNHSSSTLEKYNFREMLVAPGGKVNIVVDCDSSAYSKWYYLRLTKSFGGSLIVDVLDKRIIRSGSVYNNSFASCITLFNKKSGLHPDNDCVVAGNFVNSGSPSRLRTIKYGTVVPLLPTPPLEYEMRSTNEMLLEDKLLLYPNPATERINISLNEGFERIFIQIMSIDGKVIMEEEVLDYHSKSGYGIDITGLLNGTYLLSTSNGKEKLTTKFIKN